MSDHQTYYAGCCAETHRINGLTLLQHAKKMEVERDEARREAEEFRDDMRIYITEGPTGFTWENERDIT